ncbi:MAG: tetratricopeptide repeat protein [Lachnospiraceae bacterium]|nr:tetratricopeptide repeat protein [Lachnospiraceae bacterium]
MASDKRPIGPEDYAEPRCVLCEEPYGKAADVKPIPQRRILEKLDEYMSRRDYEAVGRHLQYWMEEAKLGKDERGELFLHNECIGHFRKNGEREKALFHVEEALSLLQKLEMEETMSGGTTYVNAGTACNAFRENERALSLFEKAKDVYETLPSVSPEMLGGLYNNMALTLQALRRFEEAEVFYQKAVNEMRKVDGGELEVAITYLNLADTLEQKTGAEGAEKEIMGLLDEAYMLLKDAHGREEGYYAFVCEKCAPSFSYYGYFAAAEELSKRAKEIYERD